MEEKKAPKDQLTEKNNGLTDTQEVLYADDFKKMDKAAEKKPPQNQDKPND